MKKTFLIFIAWLLSASLFSQEILKIEYEAKMLMDDDAITEVMKGVKVQAEGATVSPDIARAIAESMNKPTYYEMRLSPNESEYKMVERISNEQPREDGMMVKVISGSQGVIYKNIDENLALESNSSLGKNYLIQDSLKTYEWKISRESKELFGYEVRKATVQMGEESSLEAWYAPKLPYKNGPDYYQGLPGLILELTKTLKSEEGGVTKFVFAATSVSVDKNDSEIKRPAKGKKVTREEYIELLKEQSEKFKEMYGGGVDKE